METEKGTPVLQQPSARAGWPRRGVNPAECGGGAWEKGKDSLVLNFHWDDPTPVLSGEPEGHCCC